MKLVLDVGHNRTILRIKINIGLEVKITDQGEHEQMVLQFPSFDQVLLFNLLQYFGNEASEFVVIDLHFADWNSVDEEDQVLNCLSIQTLNVDFLFKQFDDTQGQLGRANLPHPK